jgi:flagellum-specific peptidoglycan hydrolase FlgJ
VAGLKLRFPPNYFFANPMLPAELDFLRRAWLAAGEAKHVFPAMAACEAALESGYGHSVLAAQDNNLFGLKQRQHPLYGTVSFPTREFLSNEWVEVEANFVRYDDWQQCFTDRMATLTRLAPVFSHYKAALNAPSGEEYVRQVSLTWSTDPERAAKVLAIYSAIPGDLLT